MNYLSEQNTRTQTGRETDLSFFIGGCSVSISSSPKGVDDPLKTVREILLSAYRTKQPRTQFFDASGKK